MCPPGYTASGGYCVLTAIDPAKNLGPQCPKCGNPITPGTGNKFQRETDYVGTGSFPLRFERYYNNQLRRTDSRTTSSGVSGTRRRAPARAETGRDTTAPLGQSRRDSLRWTNQGLDLIGANWRHTYQRSIYYVDVASGGASTAFVVRHDGRVLVFAEFNGAYYPQQDISDRLAGSPATGWTFTTADDEEVETYNADGRLESIRNRAGYTHTLTYDQNSQLTSVTDGFGHALTLTYAPENGAGGVDFQLVSMTDPAGGVYQYAYLARAEPDLGSLIRTDAGAAIPTPVDAR